MFANVITLFVDAFAKLWKATVSFVISVCPHGKTRLQLDGLSRNFTFEYYTVEKIPVSLK